MKPIKPPKIPREFYASDEDYKLGKLSPGLCLKYAAMYNLNKAPKRVALYFEKLKTYESEKAKGGKDAE